MTAAPPGDDGGDFYRRIVESSSLGLILTDLDGNILYANPRECETSGYSSDELIGRNARIFRSGTTAPETYRDLWATVTAGGIWHGEMVNRRKNGELVTEYMRISSLKGRDGTIVNYLAIKEEQLVRQPESSVAGRCSTMDGLTGLPNRHALIERLGAVISRAHAASAGFALLLVDLDGFRVFNESIGQIAADQVLLEVVSRLSASVRNDDLIARSGGDEFVLVLNGLQDEPRCAEMAGRLLHTLSQPIHIDGHDRTITGSLGIARYPSDARDAESLLRAADQAVSNSKRQGGNQYCFFAPANSGHAPDRSELVRQLRDVVQRGELRLHYQPQLSLVSGEIVGVEALIRWQHPNRGLVPPNAFIPVAEETGLIVAIGEWVLGEVCRQARVWREAGLPAIRIAANLSARHFHLASLPDCVAEVLRTTGMEPKYLELELTESAMMHDASKAVRIVDRLKGLGIRISLDDFGTGYSSLAYLSRFAIDRLKVDQSFIRDITSNPVNASITTATIAMAHKLGKIVVAEGVETEAQMHFLRRHDCDEMQGFFFSKALPADQLTELLRGGRHLSFDQSTAEQVRTTLLLVDDEQNILNALRRLFRRDGYRILTAGSGAEALELLALNPVQVIISDQRMPEMSGVELLSKVKDLYPQTVRMVLSGYSDLSAVTDAINKGAIWKYISKPWDDESLVQEVRAAFRQARPQ
jgi:diguanylate cyclase (GGDEF)-like protein/PAS domain S-box-containing protein